jgi:hypothetical protein
MLSTVLMCAFTLVAGCATHETYGDRALPQAERAVIEGYSRYLFLYFEDLQIVSVDGNLVGGQWADASSVSLPWGKHWIQFSVLRNNSQIAMCAFDWAFEAGHHYKLQHLHHQQALLAHPTSPRFTAAVSMDVSTASQPGQRLNARAECGTARHCRRASDCPSESSCERAAGFEFGTCTVL